MATIEIIDNYHELNRVGCNLILKADEFKCSLFTSVSMRWLSIREDNNSTPYTESQKKACEYLDRIVQTMGSSSWAKLNMKILLYKDPRDLRDNSHIKKLLRAGAEIRFKKSTNKTKIILQGNTLFLSFTRDIGKVVNKGLLYESSNFDDPLIEYYNELFMNEFSFARRIILDNETGEIKFGDNWMKNIFLIMKSMDTKEKVIFWGGAAISAIIGFLLSFTIN